MSNFYLAMGCDHSFTQCSQTRALSVIHSQMGSPYIPGIQFQMDPLQLSLFHEDFSLAELWKHSVTTKTSYWSVGAVFFYLFLFSCCHQAIWGSHSSRDPSPLKPPALGKAKPSGGFILSY